MKQQRAAMLVCDLRSDVSVFPLTRPVHNEKYLANGGCAKVTVGRNFRKSSNCKKQLLVWF